jgi:hypothetical protein
LGAVIGEWGEREKNSPPLFSGICIECGGHRCGEPGHKVVVKVAGCLDKAKKETKENSHFFLVSVSSAVGTDTMGQVVGVVVG